MKAFRFMHIYLKPIIKDAIVREEIIERGKIVPDSFQGRENKRFTVDGRSSIRPQRPKTNPFESSG